MPLPCYAAAPRPNRRGACLRLELRYTLRKEAVHACPAPLLLLLAVVSVLKISTLQVSAAAAVRAGRSGTVVDPAGARSRGRGRASAGDEGPAADGVGAGGRWRFANVAAGTPDPRHAGRLRDDRGAHSRSATRIRLRCAVTLKVGAVSETVTVVAGTEVFRRSRRRRQGWRARRRRWRRGGVGGGNCGRQALPPPPAPPQPSRRRAFAIGRCSSRAIDADRRRHRVLRGDRGEQVPRRRPSIPLSTFSIDVDTASYANVRRFLNEGRLPPADAVRVEELINYFKFDYPAPARATRRCRSRPKSRRCPWNPKHKLALIGLRATPIEQRKTPPRNLTFLLDVSGSMTPANRLPLVKTAMKMLVDTLRPEDRVAIVTYAGASGVALKPTTGDKKATIQAAIEQL